MSFGLQDADVLEVKLYTSMGNQVSINTRHYVCKGLNPDQTAVDAAVDLTTKLAGPMKAVISDLATYRGLSIQRLLPAPITVAHWTDDGKANGTLSGDPLPPQTAGLISLRTHLAGKSRRGRQYTPFPTEDASDPEGRPTGE